MEQVTARRDMSTGWSTPLPSWDGPGTLVVVFGGTELLTGRGRAGGGHDGPRADVRPRGLLLARRALGGGRRRVRPEEPDDHGAAGADGVSDDPGLHRILARQLRRLGLAPDRASSVASWRVFLNTLDTAYPETEDERYALERSIDISSREMRGMHEVLTRLALQDPLTGLPHRAAGRSRRRAGGAPRGAPPGAPSP